VANQTGYRSVAYEPSTLHKAKEKISILFCATELLAHKPSFVLAELKNHEGLTSNDRVLKNTRPPIIQ
jgi:hypothetical protein